MGYSAQYIPKICSWLQHAGGSLHPAVEIVHGDFPAGYSLRVREGHHLPAGSQITPMVWKLGLCYGHPPEVLTRFHLMEEFLKGEESFWHPYIQMLPQPGQHGLDTPLYYDDRDRDWIRGTNLEAAAIAREEQWRQEYLHFVGLVTSSGEHKHTLFEGKWELYKWAATILTSRCFSSTAFAINHACDTMDGPAIADNKETEDLHSSHARFPILIPVFDIANHDPAANVTWSSQMQRCSFTTNSAIRAGEEVCISYDNKSNEELILGYGFSLFHNAADVFGLVLRDGSARQELVKTRERQEKSRDKKGEPIDYLTTSEQLHETTIRTQSAEKAGHHLSQVSPLQVKQDPAMTPSASGVHCLTSATNTPFFVANRQLVNTLFAMLANSRERRDIANMCLHVWTQSSPKQSIHSRLKVVSTLFMELHRKHLAITTSDALLPPWPLTDRQFHAARYRRGQVHILETNIESLKQELRAANSANTRLVRLEDILAPSTSSKPNRLRAAIHHVLRTRDAGKLRRGGYGDLVFTLWFCSSWLIRAEGVQSDCTSFQDILNDWLYLVEKMYGLPPLEADDCESRESPTYSTVESLQTETRGNEGDDGDEYAVAGSYLDVVKMISERYPWWKFTEGRWTAKFLLWGLHIVQEEGLVFPGLDGEAGDEFVVVVSSEESSQRNVQKRDGVPAR